MGCCLPCLLVRPWRRDGTSTLGGGVVSVAKRRREVLPAQATIAWGGELWGEEEALEDTAVFREEEEAYDL